MELFMDTKIIISLVTIFIIIVAIELAWRRNKKEYNKAVETNKIGLERQKESIEILKEINATLKEVCSKLDNK
jgi:hypothetical protein